jgi:hypothetical protein
MSQVRTYCGKRRIGAEARSYSGKRGLSIIISVIGAAFIDASRENKKPRGLRLFDQAVHSPSKEDRKAKNG